MHKSILLKKKVISRFTVMFVVIAVFAFLNSCTKTITETLIEEPSWKLHESLEHDDKIILNGYVSADSIYYLSTHSKFWKFNNNNPIFCYNYWPCITQTLEYKPIISDSVSAYMNEDKTEIQLALNEIDSWNIIPEIISVWDIDSTFSDDARLPMESFFQPVGAFNNQNQFLTVVMGDGMNFCIIDYTHNDSTYSGIEITSTQRIYFFYGILGFPDIKSFGNRFYVITNDYNYIIYPTGEYHKMDNLPAGLQIFSYNDTLFTFTTNFWLYYSSDLGENWEEYAHFSAWVSFFEVAGRLCCHRHDDIHEINFKTGEVKELDNWGLEGNEITSINKFNNEVYITTLSGLFYRDVDEFFTYKEEDNGKGKLTFERNISIQT